MGADVLRSAAALMRERAEAATPGPWVVGDTSRVAGVLNGEADTCAYCRHDSEPTWRGNRDINGKRMRAHVHRGDAWDGEVHASRDDGDLRVTTGTDEYGYIDPTDATHIASWHPAVALAVADWLEMWANHCDQWQGTRAACRETGHSCTCTYKDCYEHGKWHNCTHGEPDLTAALAVARAYLGRTA